MSGVSKQESGLTGSGVIVVSRPDEHLSAIEKVYVREAFDGLWITSRHFFRNLGAHLLHLVGLGKKNKGMVTFQWPEEPRPLSRRIRARHRIMKRADGSTRCVACMMCETVCPARCITIVAAEHPDPRIEKRPQSFDIHTGVCVYCGYCVEACPEDAIRMDTYDLETSSYDRDGMILHLEDLSNHDNGDCYPERLKAEG